MGPIKGPSSEHHGTRLTRRCGALVGDPLLHHGEPFPADAVSSFASACAIRGAERARQSPAPHLRQLADAAADWAQFLAAGRTP
ncbi:hypothetical protein QLQ12_24890 [Actinoplanes sp. NEAU-A12]|uniref:Uncharacterized protein n=1 Tax=Actinoplanes sandaracinus TaxID=3045177 RepID=A0ABT6WQ42_9ACTN|nr:hypothetical protein [Actinoplanes sandaracinus]MDI6101862.1 hypothetical protein [Actinoplanes sandaracinus]